uniref:BCAS3 WD40 domain-containing protein n=1 Tax=Timema bartmani TaxID=61472 RepID=A0A7R9F978_9NEOP|nr:unnamed protein product [Timema bartmani]
MRINRTGSRRSAKKNPKAGSRYEYSDCDKKEQVKVTGPVVEQEQIAPAPLKEQFFYSDGTSHGHSKKMSAESPRKSIRHGGYIVPPQPVSDRSIIENVAGFINEVVPQSYASVPQGESKEVITWARFEYGDINDPALYPDISDDHSETPPLLLVLGYGTGVQVWAIPASGESTEVLSWRQGMVRMLRILPTPTVTTTDSYSHKRPLIALCDGTGPGPQFCSLSFISLRTGDQVKNIKFKNPVSDVLANRRSVVVTFPERIAVFDASTLEDRLTVTTCYPCPGPNPNPVALGNRWLAYSERRLVPSRRSSGGTEGEGVQSYTATVLHVAKSFGKGLRELGETVATSLTGGVGGMTAQRGMTGAGSCVMTGPQGGPINCSNSDAAIQPGIVTILDTQTTSPSSQREEQRSGDYTGPVSDVIAHFVAHSDPILALAFDPSGMLLLTADKRGHDFHLFRIQPHPGGPSLAAVHHLYTLHRGDTTAKVQDIAFAADSRWVAVSTMRGTTHVFPITPYGGTVGVRTHATPHVVNRLSRFHRSAGLTTDGRNSPIPYAASSGNYETVALSPAMPYPNPRLPPYPHPTVVLPLAQIRQPFPHSLLSTSAPTSPNLVSQQAYHRNPSVRVLGRTQSSSDDCLPGGSVPLQMTTCFAPPRAWLVGSPTVPRDSSAKAHKRVVDSLFVMTCHGSLIEYDLEPKHASGVAKEKVCDDTSIELEVHAKAQWLLLRQSTELPPPLPASNPLMALPDRLLPVTDTRQDSCDERWLSQVEIVTHAGPHRRLWMGPQFTFKTYATSSGYLQCSQYQPIKYNQS